MKFATIFLLSCFSVAFAEQQVELNNDWSNIKPLNVYVEPIGPAPAAEKQPGLRIIGGNVAARNSIPFQAALIINNSGFCGGSIISSAWILTAAHCTSGATQVQIIVGAHNPSTQVNEPTQVRIYANSRIVHSGYDSRLLTNDISLLRSTIPVGSTGISPVALAPASSSTLAGKYGTVSGWGLTSDSSNSISSELRYLSVPIITNTVCAQSYGSMILSQHLCTSGHGYVGSCNGDSGGPLTVDGVEVGIVSFGASRCESGHPSVFARVSSFRSWITTNSGV